MVQNYKLGNRILTMGDKLFYANGINFPTSGLTSYWNFNTTGSTIYDTISGMSATVEDTTFFTTLGRKENGLITPVFQGFGSKGIISTGEVNVDYGASISWWMKKAPNWDATKYHYLIAIHNPNQEIQQNGFRIQINLGKINVGTGNNNCGDFTCRYQYEYNTAFTGTDWYHYVATLTGTDITSPKLYENGILLTDRTQNGIASVVVYDKTQISLFRFFSNVTYICGVYLDEVATWNRPLTQAEVTALYNSGNGLFY